MLGRYGIAGIARLGSLGMDAIVDRVSAMTATTTARRPRVVIVGAGFGGLTAAMRLRRAKVDVIVIDRRNHHLFQPLLYQVATAALSPADIASPIRGVLSQQANAEVVFGEVTGIDTVGRAVLLNGRRVVYDQLVIATGARDSYFGHDDWAGVTSSLKTIENATDMRRRILVAFERAEGNDDPVERRRLLTFVIIGGGPTGVELAGALAELAKKSLVRDFRRIDPTTARIVLIEAEPRLLSTFPRSLSTAAERTLTGLGVEVHTGMRVSECNGCGVAIGAEHIESRTIIWAAGVAASPAATWLGVMPGRGGRVPVLPDLTLPGAPEVFVIGDTAQVLGVDGKPLPGVAPVAKQEGAYAAKLIIRRLSGKPSPGPFRYHDLGSLATIGRQQAVVDLRWIRLSGRIAWMAWSLAHIYFLTGFRNRLTVAVDWLWSYLTYQRGARIITGNDGM
jgi:NADH dehydrogenase